VKNIILCDIDGTIADVRHRLHYIQNPDGSKKAKPDWDAFHTACVNDPPFKDVVEIVNKLWLGDANRDVYFLSGRNDVVREQTVQWLENYFPDILYAELYMRKAGDRRPDTVIKLEMVRELGFTPDDVLCIFDDRQSVVDMWRENGYRVLQVAAWKE
jgi:beta-phosphoglucomutase-like phosphatase (HAD superfamily)